MRKKEWEILYIQNNLPIELYILSRWSETNVERRGWTNCSWHVCIYWLTSDGNVSLTKFDLYIKKKEQH